MRLRSPTQAPRSFPNRLKSDSLTTTMAKYRRLLRSILRRPDTPAKEPLTAAAEPREWYWAIGPNVHGPGTSAEMHRAAEEGHLRPHDRVWRSTDPAFSPHEMSGFLYHAVRKFTIEFTPQLTDLISAWEKHPTIVLTGPNNCGKTFLLETR
jgi:hypothetical protein